MVRMDRGPGLGANRGLPAIAPSKSGSTQNMAANIRVVVRVRPLNEKEMELNNRIVVDVVDDKMLVFDPKEEVRPFFYQGVQQPNKNFLKRANKELKFVFDNVCGQSATNKDVFELTTKDILASLMEGYNCSVFVYGATGAGKTFTMIGNNEHPGITYLTMEHLFYTINSFEKDREFDIGVSYIEVYNENVYDLLKPSRTPLQLREDSKYGVMVAGLTLNSIKTARELLNMLENGNKNRTQHPTDANAESSRSHAVFQVYVKMRYKTSSQLRIVKLSMIDLAGSERASATGCVGERFKEGANINKSLLSLGNCINRLADGGSYIPYRDSKLTRLLKDSLGGNCKTVMIANVSPSSVSYEDTYNTLKYAARANKIQLSIKKNIVDGDMRMSQYVKVIEELKKKVKELEAKLSLSSMKAVSKEPDLVKEKAKREWRKRILEEEEAHAELEWQLLGLMSRQRVLALRQRLRKRAFSHVADLAHRSSSEAMEQIRTEEIPRQERAEVSYLKQSAHLDSQVLTTWTKWDESRKKQQIIFEQAISDCPELSDFVEKIQMQSELRHTKARDEMRQKQLSIENDEINAFTEFMSDLLCLSRKMYLTLKGYDKVPPALTAEYLEIMKKAKSAKGITWSDKDNENDAHFKFFSTLDLNKPTTTLEYSCIKKDDVPDVNATVDIITDSEDLTDVENREPIRVSSKKRKGTPIKLANNETIIINDSFEALDTTRNLNSAKKIKREFDIAPDIENYGVIDPKDLNSTFVLTGKMEAVKNIKTETKTEHNPPVKRGLMDRTNTIQRHINFGDKAKVVKPVVGKALPFRRAAPPPNPPQTRSFGFGSSVPRDPPAQRNIQDSMARGKANITQKSVGYKAVRARDRVQAHPYSRPAALHSRK
ncbi:kinesin-like protein KIF18A isoform X1 [Trichoplusia ni]|uniref:Kinesin-like protein KIF18A isoform X1 n=1 Tax=Trichoplusia ni TaxID=7111 RepID=A0A7E5VN02_TRINI|nr:kinesin-like protein KIF18A isoform X1 [Trichoplusia ni]